MATFGTCTCSWPLSHPPCQADHWRAKLTGGITLNLLAQQYLGHLQTPAVGCFEAQGE